MDMEAAIGRWRAKVDDPELAGQLAELLENGSEAEKADAFFQELEFGTAGLRGVLGPGTNRMNIYTVGKATQGLADYLNAHYADPSVAIARDSRLKGELFVRRAACILAANGVRVWIYPRVEPTPALSFAVRYLHASAGINITASHNPAAYNGYKVYGQDGCQIASEQAGEVSRAVARIDCFDDVLSMPFDDAVGAGMVGWMGEEVIDAFIDAVAQAGLEHPDAAGARLRVVYTPLNGTGLECVEKILSRIDVDDVAVVPEQAMPDGTFETCPVPNPEMRESLRLGMELCDRVHPDLLLATDPDADRVGVACREGDGYSLLSGNEMGVLLFDYICRTRIARGIMPQRPLAVSTIVSTVMIDPIAREYGVEIKRTLTGFKWIGSIITDLERESMQNRFIFGFEESYGYLAGAHVRDKDAVAASMLICQMARYYKAEGLDLVEAMDALYRRYGYYRNLTLDFGFPGSEGAAAMARFMASLREQAPAELAGREIVETLDYRNGISGLPAADAIEFRLPDANKVIFRPSGTEPKVKAYLFARGETQDAADALLGEFAGAVRNLLGR